MTTQDRTDERVAKWPPTEEDATADAVLRFLLTQAKILECRLVDAVRDRRNEAEANALWIGWAQSGLLLEALLHVDPEAAGALARQLWRAAEDGELFADWTNDALDRIGLDPEAVILAYEAAPKEQPSWWTVPKIHHDESRAVGPFIRGSLICRDAGQSNVEHTRFYAAQLLAAADAVERAPRDMSTMLAESFADGRQLLAALAEPDGPAVCGDPGCHECGTAKDSGSVGCESADTRLWAVHVSGTDDVLAMPDRAAADAKAAEVNVIGEHLRNRPTASPDDVQFSAEVVPWPYSAEDHAKALAVLAADGGEYTP
jgi:hypothetical protein